MAGSCRSSTLGLAVAVAGCWILFGARPAKVPFRISEGVSTAGQIDYLLRHIGSAIDVASRTLSGSGRWHYKQFIGVFGWSDTYLPAFYYPIAFLALFIGAALCLCEAGQALRPIEGLSLFVGWIVAWAATYGVLYLTWTPVGAATVDGIQGRYFLASAMLLVPALPAMAFWHRASGTRFFEPVQARQACPRVDGRISAGFGAAAWLFVFVSATASDWFIPQVILARFYL